MRTHRRRSVHLSIAEGQHVLLFAVKSLVFSTAIRLGRFTRFSVFFCFASCGRVPLFFQGFSPGFRSSFVTCHKLSSTILSSERTVGLQEVSLVVLIEPRYNANYTCLHWALFSFCSRNFLFVTKCLWANLCRVLISAAVCGTWPHVVDASTIFGLQVL